MMECGEEGGVGADGQEGPEEGPGDEGASWAWGCGVSSAGDDDGEENDVGGEDECGLDERRFWLANMAEEGKTMQTCEQPEQRVEPRERRRRR